jgi:large subunit ribosomal protein L29
MKIQEIRDMNIEQLKKLIAEKRAEAVKLRFDIAARQVKNHRQYRVLKADIAKALTVVNEKSKAI